MEEYSDFAKQVIGEIERKRITAENYQRIMFDMQNALASNRCELLANSANIRTDQNILGNAYHHVHIANKGEQ